MSRYNDYSVQALSLSPMAYWELNSSTKEFSQGEAFNYLTKVNHTASNRALLWGSIDDGVKLDGLTSSINISMPDCCPIGKPGKESRSWTINFVYQHLSDVFTNDVPVFKIGTDLELYFSGQKFYLNLRGKEFYASIDDYKQIFHISIINNKSGGNLIVNEYQSESVGSPSVDFSENTEMVFSCNGNADYQVSNLSMFNRELAMMEISKLKDAVVYGDEYYDFISKYDSHILDGNFYSSDIISKHSPSGPDVNLRNCVYSDGNFYLKSKPLATVIGATFSSTGISFSSSDYVYVGYPESNLLDSKIDIHADFSGSGTLIHMDMYQDLVVSVDSGGNLDIAIQGSSAYNESISGEYISVGFLSGKVFVDTGSGYVDSDIQLELLQSIDAINIGNSLSLDSAFSKKIQSFEINYYSQPLALGIYKLDFNYDYGSAVSIKPQQSGLGIWSVALPYEFATTSVDFIKLSANSHVKTFTDLDFVSDESWFTGSVGTNIYPGTSAKRYSQANTYEILNASFNTYSEILSSYDLYSDIATAEESDPIVQNLDGSSVVVKFVVLLEDLENGSSKFVSTSPGISNLSISTYSTNTLYSLNSILEVTSSDQDAIIASDAGLGAGKKRISTFKIFKDSDVTVSNLPDLITQIDIRLLLDSAISSTGTGIEVLALDTFKLSMNRSQEAYTLINTNGTLYVDGQLYSGQTLSIHNDYLITYRVTSGTYTSMTLKNLAGFIINGLDFVTGDTSSLSISDLANSLRYSPYTVVYDIPETMIHTDFVPSVTTISSYSIISG